MARHKIEEVPFFLKASFLLKETALAIMYKNMHVKMVAAILTVAMKRKML